MRGDGDAQNPDLIAKDLEEIIQVQQSILSDVYETDDLLDVPQAWVLYKVRTTTLLEDRLKITLTNSLIIGSWKILSE